MRQFSIHPDEMETLSFKIRSYARYEYEKGAEGTLHIHAYTEIMFITEGKGWICLSNEKIPVQRGMIIVVKPGVKHAEFAAANAKLEMAFFGVSQVSLETEGMKKHAGGKGIYCMDFSSRYEKAFNYVRQIEREYAQKKGFWQYALASRFNSFIVFIMRAFQFTERKEEQETHTNVATMLYSHLRASYQQDISLESLAKRFNLSKYYIAHMFKREYGVSIISKLNEIRCDEAHNMLMDSDYSVTEIASIVGFNSVAHFSATYKKRYGISPREARQKFQQSKKLTTT